MRTAGQPPYKTEACSPHQHPAPAPSLPIALLILSHHQPAQHARHLLTCSQLLAGFSDACLEVSHQLITRTQRPACKQVVGSGDTQNIDVESVRKAWNCRQNPEECAKCCPWTTAATLHMLTHSQQSPSSTYTHSDTYTYFHTNTQHSCMLVTDLGGSCGLINNKSPTCARV